MENTTKYSLPETIEYLCIHTYTCTHIHIYESDYTMKATVCCHKTHSMFFSCHYNVLAITLIAPCYYRNT